MKRKKNTVQSPLEPLSWIKLLTESDNLALNTRSEHMFVVCVYALTSGDTTNILLVTNIIFDLRSLNGILSFIASKRTECVIASA